MVRWDVMGVDQMGGSSQNCFIRNKVGSGVMGPVRMVWMRWRMVGYSGRRGTKYAILLLLLFRWDRNIVGWNLIECDGVWSGPSGRWSGV